MPGGDVAEPSYVRDVTELAQNLKDGRWCVFRHEHLGDNCELGSWIEAVRVACAELGVVEQVFIIPRRDLSVVVNTAALPTFEQVQLSIARVELDRWLARDFPSKSSARSE